VPPVVAPPVVLPPEEEPVVELDIEETHTLPWHVPLQQSRETVQGPASTGRQQPPPTQLWSQQSEGKLQLCPAALQHAPASQVEHDPTAPASPTVRAQH
jgi:hypothetical protein